MEDRINYRLALILPHSRLVVVTKVDAAYVLPQIGIPSWERPAEQLTKLIEEQWHIKSIVLDTVFDDRPESPLAVVEIRTTAWEPSDEGFTKTDLDAISEDVLKPNERNILHSILSGTESGRGPFSRIGWIDDAEVWIQEVTNCRGSSFTGHTTHLSPGGRFCLSRFTVSSGARYWLKATGAPNTREFDITTFLAEVCPQYLPRLVSSRKDWNAWLMEEHGACLSESSSLEDFRQAVHTMADLQKFFVGKSELLCATFCGNHRNAVLKSGVAEIIVYLDQAMKRQTSTKAPRLSSSKLKNLGAALQDACSLQQELGIPDSLIHSDVNSGNILYDGNRYVFTDWCGANVGNPFLTLEQMCVHTARISKEPELWGRTLRAEYKTCWADLLTDRQIERALQLARLLSILSSLHESFKSPMRYESERLSYSRSLARHIDRTMREPGVLEALCH